MAEGRSEEEQEVVCPHCKKTFSPEPLTGHQTRHRGFKCPHCRLFVASSRVEAATPRDP